MRNKLFGLGIAVLALALAGCEKKEPAPASTAAADTAALRALSTNDYVRAYNTRNFTSLGALFTEDAISMPADRPAVAGKEAVVANFQREFEQYPTAVISLSAEDAAASGDWGHVQGTFHWTGSPQSGAAAVEIKGKYISLYRREPGGWKLARICWNSDHPMPPPAK